MAIPRAIAVCIGFCCVAVAAGQASSNVCAASEGDTCHCQGQVYLGRKYVNGKPGSGQTTSLATLMSQGHKEMPVDGQITCSNSAMGGDPLPGIYKWCYCVPTIAGACPLTDQETKINAYIRDRQQRIVSGQIANQIASGAYTINSLQDDLIEWWVQISLAGQNAAIGNFVDLMQHAHNIPPPKSFLTVVLGWIGLIIGAMDRPVLISEEMWKIIANAPAAMSNAVLTWKAAAVSASSSGNFLEAAMQFRSSLPDQLTTQLSAVDVYINALRNIPESQRNQGLLVAYHHVTIVIQSTISTRKAFNQYYNSFIDGATEASWAPQPFYFTYGEDGAGLHKNILWRPAPSGLDPCTVAEYVFNLNKKCIKKMTPGFEQMQMLVEHYGGGMGAQLGVQYHCSNLEEVTGCWSPQSFIAYGPGAGLRYLNTSMSEYSGQCHDILTQHLVWYQVAHTPVPAEGKAFCLDGITAQDTFSACNMDSEYPGKCFAPVSVCKGSRRLAKTSSILV